MPTVISGSLLLPRGSQDETTCQNYGLSKEDIARVCIRSVDSGTQFTFMPVWFPNGLYTLYRVLPRFLELVGLFKAADVV